MPVFKEDCIKMLPSVIEMYKNITTLKAPNACGPWAKFQPIIKARSWVKSPHGFSRARSQLTILFASLQKTHQKDPSQQPSHINHLSTIKMAVPAFSDISKASNDVSSIDFSCSMPAPSSSLSVRINSTCHASLLYVHVLILTMYSSCRKTSITWALRLSRSSRTRPTMSRSRLPANLHMRELPAVWYEFSSQWGSRGTLTRSVYTVGG